MGRSCLLAPLVMGYNLVPEPPARTMPFIDYRFRYIYDIDLNPSPIGSEPLDGAPATIGIDGGIEYIGRAHDIGFDRFHRQEPVGRDLLEAGRVEDGIDTAHRQLEGGGIEEGEGGGVGHGGEGGRRGVGSLVGLVVGKMRICSISVSTKCLRTALLLLEMILILME